MPSTGAEHEVSPGSNLWMLGGTQFTATANSDFHHSDVELKNNWIVQRFHSLLLACIYYQPWTVKDARYVNCCFCPLLSKLVPEDTGVIMFISSLCRVTSCCLSPCWTLSCTPETSTWLTLAQVGHVFTLSIKVAQRILTSESAFAIANSISQVYYLYHVKTPQKIKCLQASSFNFFIM